MISLTEINNATRPLNINEKLELLAEKLQKEHKGTNTYIDKNSRGITIIAVMFEDKRPKQFEIEISENTVVAWYANNK